MKILVYHAKNDDEYWLADSPEQQRAAMQQLFKTLDELSCFDDISFTNALERARSGDHYAIKAILRECKGVEYADWQIVDAIDPLVE